MFIIVAAPWGPNHLQFRAHRALLVTDNPDDSDETCPPPAYLRRLEQQTHSDIASRHKQERTHLDGCMTQAGSRHADRGRELACSRGDKQHTYSRLAVQRKKCSLW